MLGLFIGAAILGSIIAVMEQGDFPGWGKMLICVLAAVVPATVLNMLLPPGMFIIGLAVGAACAGVAISALCGMSLQRSSIAAGIYLAVQTVISIGLYALSR
jgi:hypothetical protein